MEEEVSLEVVKASENSKRNNKAGSDSSLADGRLTDTSKERQGTSRGRAEQPTRIALELSEEEAEAEEI